MYQPSRLQLRTLTIPKNKTIAAGIAIFFFFASLYIYPLYTFGDVLAYRNFYEEVADLNFPEAFFLYQNALGTSEPGYFLLVKLLSDFVQKDLLMSLLNGALIYSLLTWADRHRVSWIAISLLSLNFYLLVLLFPAERLKLAILFLMISVNAHGLRRPIFSAFAFLSHTQTALLIVNWITLKVTPVLRQLVAGKLKKGSWKIIAPFLFFGLLLIPMAQHILSKFDSYGERSDGFSELLKPAIFIALTLVYARAKRLNALAMHFPVAIAAILVGGSRTVIFSYFIFLNYALQYKKGLNLGIFISSAYFLIQGIEFLQNIFTYGNGFPGN